MKTIAGVIVLSFLAGPAFSQTRVAMVDRLGVARAVADEASLEQARTRQEWQQQFDLAEARKHSGTKKIWIGLGAAVGGVVVGVAAAESCVNSILSSTSTIPSCSGSSVLANLGWLASVGGDALVIWGAVDFFSAKGDLQALEASRPKSSTATVSLGDHQALQWSVGKRSAVSYRVSW